MILPQKPLKTTNRAKSLWYKIGLVVLLALALLIAWKVYASGDLYSHTNYTPPDHSCYFGGSHELLKSGTLGILKFYNPAVSNEGDYTFSFAYGVTGNCSKQIHILKEAGFFEVDFSGNSPSCVLNADHGEPGYDDIEQYASPSFIVDCNYVNSSSWMWEELTSALPGEPQIIATSPTSGSTITSTSTNLIFNYLNLDWDTYDGFIINFKDSKGVRATSKLFEEADLDPSGSGSETLPLSDFDIDQNGNWYLTGYAYGTTGQFGGNPPVLYGTIDIYSDELVLDNYYLNFNVEGLSEPYTFASSTDWYSEKVDRFASPTAMFSAFVGLLAPIFEKVADFGTRVQGMLNQTEAYDRGFSLGEVFPILNGYVAKIDGFFGSFPLASFLKYACLIMLAIFIVRAVLHFIPFFH